MYNNDGHRASLAWHETLELHELVASQSVNLFQLKNSIRHIQDSEIKSLYIETIKSLEKNIQELLPFYPKAPSSRALEYRESPSAFYLGNLLGLAKSSVKNYAAAITETATPGLRKVMVKHLNNAIAAHEKIFNIMSKKGHYPAYDINKLMKNDLKLAQKALSEPY